MRITQNNFDERARAYLAAKRRKETGEADMKELKEPFVRFLRKQGTMPDQGKKSLAFATEFFRAMASFGQSTSVEADRVEEFRRHFERRGRAVDFGSIFTARTEYIVMPTALQDVQQLPKKLQALFRRTQQIKAKAPSLMVEPIKPKE